MERQKMKHRRQLGLRQGMLGIILLCWVLPVVLIVTLGGVYILDSMTRQYRSDMMRSAQSAAAITGRNLDSMIAASRKASYIATMGNAWASYTKTGDYVTFYNEMQTFLTQQYRYDDKFRNTIVTLVDDPAAPIYTSNTSYTSIRKYQQHVRDEVLVRSEALGTGIGFFAADGSLYMMRNLLDANYRTYGVLVMELNTDTLFDSMRSVIWMTDATVWLGDAEYTVAGSVRDAGELRGNIRAGGQGGAPGLDDRLGRGEVRLADLQVDHIVAGGLQLVGPRQQGHDMERLDGPTARAIGGSHGYSELCEEKPILTKPLRGRHQPRQPGVAPRLSFW